MENKDLYELIDGYLDGSLTEAERRELERRHSEDADFRQQVQLQRELRETLGNPGRQRLRSLMADMMETEPLPPDIPTPPPAKAWWKWAALLAIVVVAGNAVWWWQRSDATPTQSEKPSKGAVEAPPSPIPADTVPAVPDSPPVENSPASIEKPAQTPPKTKQQDIPIAATDPAALERNASWDAKVEGLLMGSEELRLSLAAPKLDANFPPGKDGLASIRFNGTLKYAGSAETVQLTLLIYDNKNRRPISEIPISLKKAETDLHLLDHTERLKLQPGLYYFMLETAEGDALTGGRFTVKP